MTKYINLKHYTTKIKDLTSIRNRIRENLGKEIFEIKDFQTLQYEALRQFSSIRNTLKNDPDSINYAAKKVMDFFKLPKATISELNEHNQFVEIEPEKEDTPLDLFNYFILGFDTTPCKELKRLKVDVEFHLKSIVELINNYENENYINQYRKYNRNPSNNQERMLLDFYKRCIKERDLILNYYLYGMEKRAIQKANTRSGLNWWNINSSFYDFPYKSWHQYSIEYFDYKKINSAAHRYSDISAGERYESLYNTNKQLFYKKLIKIKPVGQIFSKIAFYYEHIPYKNDRQSVFSELKRLFKAKRWLAFYALALPQVEGLFTEMLTTINPDEKGKSLSEKVEKVRPAYILSDSYFDYYQYIIPELRNKFAHIGFEDDLRLKCYDLLTDLEHILQVYYELDNPLVKIKRLIRQSNPKDFAGYKEIAIFFELVNQLHHSQKREITAELDNFINDFLTKDCQLEYILGEHISSTSSIIKKTIHRIEIELNSAATADEFNRKNIKQIAKIVDEHKDKLVRLTYRIDLFEDLQHIKNCYDAVNKYLKNGNQVIRKTS